MRPDPKLFSRVRQSGVRHWYVNVLGKQYSLGSDEEAARREYLRLLLKRRIKGSVDSVGGTPRVSVIILEYLEWVTVHRKRSTYTEHNRILMDLVENISFDLRANEINRGDVLKWIESHKSWGDGGKRSAIACINSCMNWARGRDRIPYNPVEGIEKPPKGRRETIIDSDQRAKILKAIEEPEFKDAFVVLTDQGLRPQEIRDLEARHLDLAAGIAALPRGEHKTGAKTKRERTIYLTDASIAILRRLAKRRKTGPLFRDPDGNAWTRHTMHTRFKWIRAKCPDVPSDLSAYVMRHTYVTNAIEAGLSDSMIAELTGHVDASMIQRVYGHIGKRKKSVREAAVKLSVFSGASAARSAARSATVA